ncbi:uncharacterized protein K452DRAFT_316504 [Aplosporella prunicola CBS 121167]|uniref:RecQ-mediated genome instability protein 1 n=1 Tax=Aplosporella prunicola CBS 121167 TaxID=1176127 RepID=A0A6A6BK86_9PEZI|nr:uncharacterized protein K452DRAFT_316504 [Aplosporella prunicola CBS 121167]KAF2144529.1 hypothetical protein K452DRAFT_316504 [Aplosporella prunicola CBS 121167]
MDRLAQEITAHLASKGLHPTHDWLSNFMSTVRQSTALAAIKQTALFRLLASDITQSLRRSQSSMFPGDILNGTIKERVLPGPIVVQVIEIEDIGRSCWSQVEALEAAERGEMTKGREVIRVVPDEQGTGGPTQTAADEVNAGNGPHKLLLMDVSGTRVYALELFAVNGIGLRINIGAKLVLRNVVVARGLVLLEPKTTTFVGGKIDALHKAWIEGRKERLKAAAGMAN